MRSIKKLYLFFLIAGWTLTGISPAVAGGDVPLMSKEELKDQLGNPQLVVIDVRQGRDWSSSEFMIQGAVRHAPEDFDNWAQTFPMEKILVLYCA